MTICFYCLGKEDAFHLLLVRFFCAATTEGGIFRLDLWGPEAGGKKRDQMAAGSHWVGGVASPFGQSSDAIRPCPRVVDRAQQEMKPPQDVLTRELWEASTQRIHEHAAGLVEIFRDQLLKQCGVFRREDRPQTGENAYGHVDRS